ncbi:MAG: hypothetical protein RIR26_970, partial [Pseudomonadota bacterium]
RKAFGISEAPFFAISDSEGFLRITMALNLIMRRVDFEGL